jgi:hypothetical protein
MSGQVCSHGFGSFLQIDDDFSINGALVPLITLLDNKVPDGARTSIRDELSPFCTSKDQLAFFWTQIYDCIEQSQVEAPHLDTASLGRECDRCSMAVFPMVVLERRVWRFGRDDWINGRQGFVESAGEEQLSSLAVGSGYLRRLGAGRGERRYGRGQVLRRERVLIRHG